MKYDERAPFRKLLMQHAAKAVKQETHWVLYSNHQAAHES